MGKYSDHFEEMSRKKEEARIAAQQDRAAAIARQKRMLEEGRAWLENNIIAPLIEAKKDLNGKVLITHDQTVRSEELHGDPRHFVTFSVNPWMTSSYRSFLFEVAVNSRGRVATTAHNTNDGSVRPWPFTGDIKKMSSVDFDDILFQLVDGVIKQQE